MKKYSLSRDERLIRNSEFRTVLAEKNRFSDELLILYIAKNDYAYSRLGVSIGKSYGSAFMRNRIKRLVKEAFRLNKPKIPAGFDYLVMVSKMVLNSDKSKDCLKKLDLEQVEKSFMGLINHAKKKLSQ